MQRQAPIFSTAAMQGSGVVGGAFTEWVYHYNGCADCQRDDWYDPVTVAHYCKEGQHLFSNWARAAQTSHRIF